MQETIASCLHNAGLNADEIDYIEAHGIGNIHADALELAALHEAYGSRSEKADKTWHLSSVKPTVGHPELASGMAALIKAVCALRTRQLPPLATADAPNDEFECTHRFSFSAFTQPWMEGPHPRRVGLNSFGIGGLNAHLILEEFASKTCGLTPSPEMRQDEKGPALPARISAQEINQEATDIVDELAREIFGLTFSEIDPEHSLIQLGLDSIQILQFLHRINSSLCIDLRFSQLMRLQTLGQLYELVSSQPRIATQHLSRNQSFINPRQNAITGVVEEEKGEHPLSETQRGLWFISEALDRNTSFNVPFLFELLEPLNVKRFESALTRTLDRHVAVRVRFSRDDQNGELVQKISPSEGLVNMETLQLDSDVDWRTLLFERLRQPFQLLQEPLIRVFHIRTSKHEFVFFIVHHVVIDGLSAIVFSNTLWQYYTESTDNTINDLLSLPAPRDDSFFEFISWEKEYLAGSLSDADREYWSEKLTGVTPRIDLPRDSPRENSEESIGVGSVSCSLKPDVFKQLKTAAAIANATPSSFLLSLFFVF